MDSIFPSLSELRRLSQQGNLIPVYKEILADLETPVSVYQRVAAGEKYSFLLESVEGGEQVARYSFIGVRPFLIFRSRKDTVTLTGEIQKIQKGDPLTLLREIFKAYKSVPIPELPRLTAGAVGYFAYDAVRLWEKIPESAHPDLDLDDIYFGFYDAMIIFDNRKHKIKIVSSVLTARGPLGKQYERSVKTIHFLERLIRKPRQITVKKKGKASGPVRFVSNFSNGEYQKTVEKCKDYIRAGDIFQIVPSQRFSGKIKINPLDIYRMLRIVNPSPYNFYIQYNDLAMAGSSPEQLVRVEDGWVETRPLAGTRRRGKTPEEDLALEKELLTDEKERAEHIMLVDLGRNDLGRVCEYGTVLPQQMMFIERYSHVMHIVSSLRGKLRQDKDSFDALMACFPAGTLTGAPKIRAMEIINEVEPQSRGVYGGAVGYLDFSGNLDSCIVIRTILINKGKVYIQAGAGIVADSGPENEYQETLNKAQALFKAVHLAQQENFG